MEIVIKIDDERYKDIQRIAEVQLESNHFKTAEQIIANGTPLPKGHKVIDAYALQEHLALVPMEDRTYHEAVEIIDRFPSIIEADKESEEK